MKCQHKFRNQCTKRGFAEELINMSQLEMQILQEKKMHTSARSKGDCTTSKKGSSYEPWQTGRRTLIQEFLQTFIRVHMSPDLENGCFFPVDGAHELTGMQIFLFLQNKCGKFNIFPDVQWCHGRSSSGYSLCMTLAVTKPSCHFILYKQT